METIDYNAREPVIKLDGVVALCSTGPLRSVQALGSYKSDSRDVH